MRNKTENSIVNLTIVCSIWKLRLTNNLLLPPMRNRSDNSASSLLRMHSRNGNNALHQIQPFLRQPIISNLVTMSIATSKKLLARQRQHLLAKVTEPLAIQNVIDEVRVSVHRLKKVWRTLQHLQKIHYEYIIRHLICKNCYFGKLLVRGGEFSGRVRKSVVWEDVESALEGRLKTSIIINVEHLDIQDFLANAKTQFLREVQKVLRQENAVTVNTTLEGEYNIVKNDEEFLELKTFNTANKPILQTIDVTQWFIDNVQEPLLRKSSDGHCAASLVLQ